MSTHALIYWNDENKYSKVLRSSIISGFQDCELIGKVVPVKIGGKPYFGKVLNVGKSQVLFITELQSPKEIVYCRVKGGDGEGGTNCGRNGCEYLFRTTRVRGSFAGNSLLPLETGKFLNCI